MTQGSHAVITGPIQALVTLEDGTVVNASPPVIYFDTQDQALDAADKIGKHYEANGHPDDIEQDENGDFVQREFVYLGLSDDAEVPAKKSAKKTTDTPKTKD